MVIFCFGKYHLDPSALKSLTLWQHYSSCNPKHDRFLSQMKWEVTIMMGNDPYLYLFIFLWSFPLTCLYFGIVYILNSHLIDIFLHSFLFVLQLLYNNFPRDEYSSMLSYLISLDHWHSPLSTHLHIFVVCLKPLDIQAKNLNMSNCILPFK